MPKHYDAYGSELMAVYRGNRNTLEIFERADGLISVSIWPLRYFSDYSSWNKGEKQVMRLVKGRVLDIGCGAGRHGLYLQQKGFDVTGIDNSPGAIKVCKLRGYKKARVRSITEIHRFKPQSFDTIIMMGNNFGLFGGYKQARRLLKQMHRITTPKAGSSPKPRTRIRPLIPCTLPITALTAVADAWVASCASASATRPLSATGSITS